MTSGAPLKWGSLFLTAEKTEVSPWVIPGGAFSGKKKKCRVSKPAPDVDWG